MTEEAAKGLLLVMIGIDPVHEAELNDWYDVEHFPERMVCPGFLNGRRFTAVEGAPKYLAIYDLENPGVLHSAPYLEIAGPTRWTRRIAARFAPIVRNVYVEIRPPVTQGERLTGEGLLLVAIDVDPLHDAELNRWYDEEHIAERILAHAPPKLNSVYNKYLYLPAMQEALLKLEDHYTNLMR